MDESEGYAKARSALAIAGFVAVTIPLDSKGRVAGEPSLIVEGIPDEVHPSLHEAVDSCMRKHNPKRDDEDALKETTRRAVRRAAANTWGKKPVTRVAVVWV